MKIIAIETSHNICGIALIEEGKCIYIVENKIPRQHAEKLPIFYNELLDKNNFQLSKIDAIALSIGPGSFTGLRIGLSYSKGLAYSYNLPLIPVPTLQTLIYGSKIQEGKIIVILHSHGNKYFVQESIFKNEKSISISEPVVLDITVNNIDDLNLDLTNCQIVQYGCGNVFDSLENKGNIISVKPSARLVGELAHRHFNKWLVKNPYKLVPEYVSSFNFG